MNYLVKNEGTASVRYEGDALTATEFVRDGESIAQLGELLRNHAFRLDQLETIMARPSQRQPSSFSMYLEPQLASYIALANDSTASENKDIESQVPISKVLETGALLLALTCISALVTWIIADVPLLNPFGATIGLLVSPVFYAMGRIARRTI